MGRRRRSICRCRRRRCSDHKVAGLKPCTTCEGKARMTRTIAGVVAALIIVPGWASAQTTVSFPATTTPGQPPSPQGANANAPTPGTSILRGHVVASDSGQPLRKAQVRITAGEIRENRLPTTDIDGFYEFKEVCAGRYTINASKGSYVGLSYGQQRPTDAPKPIAILDNQT